MPISKILNGPSDDGIERMAVFFRGHAFAPHRHDTYAVGLTSAGVQAFTYRGVTRRCLPGEAFVLHPDEKHDGRPGDERGFGYRVAYIDPALLLTAAGTGHLPFIRDPVSGDTQLAEAIQEVVQAQEGDANDVALTSSLARLADVMLRLAGTAPTSAMRVHPPGLHAARNLLIAKVQRGRRCRNWRPPRASAVGSWRASSAPPMASARIVIICCGGSAWRAIYSPRTNRWPISP